MCRDLLGIHASVSLSITEAEPVPRGGVDGQEAASVGPCRGQAEAGEWRGFSHEANKCDRSRVYEGVPESLTEVGIPPLDVGVSFRMAGRDPEPPTEKMS